MVAPAGRWRGFRSITAAAWALALVVFGPGTKTALPVDAISRASVASDGTQGNAESLGSFASGDGRFVAFFSMASTLVPGDTNDARDVFIHDTTTGATSRVSVASDGSQADRNSFRPVMSPDGRDLAFDSEATNLIAGDTNGTSDVFVHDRATGATARVSVASDGTQANGASLRAALSPDGRFVAFESDATNLVPRTPTGRPMSSSTTGPSVRPRG